jgi:type VI secretion system protein ImpC
MSTSDSGKVNFDFTFHSQCAFAPRDPDAPLHLLILADFSGRAQRSLHQPLATRRVLRVDCDNLERVFAGFGAALDLEVPNANAGKVRLRLESLDDFHPDRLLKQLPGLAELLSARRLLQSPSTAIQGTEKVAALLKTTIPAPEQTAAPAGADKTESESNAETLTRLLGNAPAGPQGPAAKPGGTLNATALIRQIVGDSNVVPAAPAGTAGLLAAADLELSSQLRAVLHQPTFQCLEAAWRGLDFLVRRLPDEEQLKLIVLDVSVEELAADPDGLLRLLRDAPPAVMVADYIFGANETDLNALAGLGKLCASLNCALLGGAHPQLVGCDNFARHPDPDDWRQALPETLKVAWQALRTSSEAQHVSLSLPRFLIRQPYGAKSDPIESFEFEEIPAPYLHETFLWANSAFLSAYLLAEAFLAEGRQDDSTAASVVGELPVFRYTMEGETTIKPCAEAWLTDRAANVILHHGVTPCLSIKGRDAVRVVGIQSISSPAKPLALKS